jgi:hypothetical protein
MTEERNTKKEDKKIDVVQVVEYLNYSFAKSLQKITTIIGSRNTKGTKVYQYQVDFCYLIDEIQRGPQYILPKIIQDANDLIIAMEQEKTNDIT